MQRLTKFIISLIICLILLTWGAWSFVREKTTAWFIKDLNLRAELAVHGAKNMLIANWETRDLVQLQQHLSELTHDVRIMSAAACDKKEMLVKTLDFPIQILCENFEQEQEDSFKKNKNNQIVLLPGGFVHISIVSLENQGKVLGSIILVHDFDYVIRREGQTQNFLLIIFSVVAILSAVVTIIAVKLAWKDWSNVLKQAIRDDSILKPEFQPMLKDVRQLIERVISEREIEHEEGVWNPERLKKTLRFYLEGDKVLVLANREPYIHEKNDDGSIQVRHPASGLVTALEPVLRACSGVWIAHGSGSADREVCDSQDRVRVPPDNPSYLIKRVWLTEEEEKGYYYGFANEGLWPLCHLAHNRPIFRSEDWKQYQMVNQKFVDAACAEATSDDPIILVQDYHLALAPKLIRDKLPRATVITFWHIPWPTAEHFGICPWRNAILEGMLGSSIMGFHTQADCNNFIDSVERFLEARTDREDKAIIQQGLSTLVRPYPISLEWPVSWLKDLPSAEQCRKEIISELKINPNVMIGIGVDRLDYTKGVEERILTVEYLLEKNPVWQGKFSFIQLAAPSRTLIDRYRQLNDTVELLCERINTKFGTENYQPIYLLRAHHEPAQVFKFYRAADVCYVSSLHDGMNLVAKEFVASRDDEQGVLILSQFTGASRELTEALIVNPYDLDQAGSALEVALNMSKEEQRTRMRSMRKLLSEFNIYRWAGRMIVDAAKLRKKDRLSGVLNSDSEIKEGGITR
ncbi:MAG: trehalose-6-phosphate synthase [Proteobacteria bacterium]|nr:trehalose-6-phosphate synthase [Pseudomonadota bacterium]